MLKSWFLPCIIHAVSSFRRKDHAVSLWVSAAKFEGLGARLLTGIMKKSVFAASTCIFALGGALVGTIVGAMKGHTTETGFLRGSGVGAVAGAITAVQLLDSMANGEPLSKVADLLYSLLEGKVFMEWVSPAVLKAYQWQIIATETTFGEISDIYESDAGVRGLSKDCIQNLPEFTFQSKDNTVEQCCPEFCCSICLQDFKDGDSMREIPYCGHLFHLDCIDKWLARNGSCPICRNYLCNDNDV